MSYADGKYEYVITRHYENGRVETQQYMGLEMALLYFSAFVDAVINPHLVLSPISELTLCKSDGFHLLTLKTPENP